MGNFFCLKCGIGQVVFKSKNCREYSCREHRFDKKIFVETVVFLKIPILEIVAINGLTLDLSSVL